jgi:hypothetical protein
VHLLSLSVALSTPSQPSFYSTLYSTFAFFSYVRDQVALGFLIPTFGAHRGLSPKAPLTMPPRRLSQRLHPDEGSTQTSDQNQTHHPSTQSLATIAEGVEHPTFNTIPQVQPQPANMSTAAGSRQNGGAASSTQTNGGASHQSPRGNLCRFRSSMAAPTSIKSKCKPGTRKQRKLKL